MSHSRVVRRRVASRLVGGLGVGGRLTGPTGGSLGESARRRRPRLGPVQIGDRPHVRTWAPIRPCSTSRVCCPRSPPAADLPYSSSTTHATSPHAHLLGIAREQTGRYLRRSIGCAGLRD